MADDHRAVVALDPVDEAVPLAAGGLALAAPGEVEQVEGGPEVAGLQAERVVHVVAGELGAVGREPVLEVRRARLRRPDMEVHATSHAAILPYPPRAWTTREGLGRPSCPAIQTLVATRLSRSTPVSIPSPCSIHTRSSVARLPVALSA